MVHALNRLAECFDVPMLESHERSPHSLSNEVKFDFRVELGIMPEITIELPNEKNPRVGLV